MSKPSELHQPHEPGLAIPVSILFAATLVLVAMFQSSALLTLTYDLAPGGFSERLVATAEHWHAAMQTIGIADMSGQISEAVVELHEMKITDN